MTADATTVLFPVVRTPEHRALKPRCGITRRHRGSKVGAVAGAGKLCGEELACRVQGLAGVVQLRERPGVDEGTCFGEVKGYDGPPIPAVAGSARLSVR